MIQLQRNLTIFKANTKSFHLKVTLSNTEYKKKHSFMKGFSNSLFILLWLEKLVQLFQLRFVEYMGRLILLLQQYYIRIISHIRNDSATDISWLFLLHFAILQ